MIKELYIILLATPFCSKQLLEYSINYLIKYST